MHAHMVLADRKPTSYPVNLCPTKQAIGWPFSTNEGSTTLNGLLRLQYRVIGCNTGPLIWPQSDIQSIWPPASNLASFLPKWKGARKREKASEWGYKTCLRTFLDMALNWKQGPLIGPSGRKAKRHQEERERKEEESFSWLRWSWFDWAGSSIFVALNGDCISLFHKNQPRRAEGVLATSKSI